MTGWARRKRDAIWLSFTFVLALVAMIAWVIGHAHTLPEQASERERVVQASGDP
jgi:hypothetical protein